MIVLREYTFEMTQSQMKTFKFIQRYHLDRFNYYTKFRIEMFEFDNIMALNSLKEEIGTYVTIWRHDLLNVFEKDSTVDLQDMAVADIIRQKIVAFNKALEIVDNMIGLREKFEAKVNNN
jgi:hypothetical protein